MKSTLFILFVLCTWALAYARPEALELDENTMHPSLEPRKNKLRAIDTREATASYWNENAQNILTAKVNRIPNENTAKNVIMFLGDGMSIPTLTATRVLYGGEEQELSFEKMPYSALSKTYCVDAQTADSACTATAYLGGVKNNIGTIGVTATVLKDDCESMLLEENQVQSIARWSQNVGKRTGIVTTSTVTDASPSGAYAHIANRNWQTDGSVTSSGQNATKCKDITYQLVKWDTGKNFNIILGGGSSKWLTTDSTDPLGSTGERTDGINLIDEWSNDKEIESKTAEYVWNRTGLLNIADNTDYVLGLFSAGYMPYNLDRNTSLTPSLEEMTEIAIKIASRGNGEENGYFLFIEGGRIDHGHHANWAKKAFDETIEFSKAIEKALELTNEEDTLIVVTADHAHTMSVAGYPDRNNDILGSPGLDDTGLPRLTINYANGPGFVESGYNNTDDNTTEDSYRFPSVSYLSSETHGADDVGIFANGPWAHLFTGVVEENVIPHIMAYASCVGDGLTACSGAFKITTYLNLPTLLIVISFYRLVV